MPTFFVVAALFQLILWATVLRCAYTPTGIGPLAPDPEARVSVIVCFRNEADSLDECISRILAQVFPGKFELILVDDNSTDNSASVAHPYIISNENVRLLDPGPTAPGKKEALAFGIDAARYDHLLLTDADCIPASSHWLWVMTEPLRLGQELVLGASPLMPEKNEGFLARWQWFESTYVSLKYLGFANRKRPYMGVGRNLAYTKDFYRRAGGFANHKDLPGGDDDLLISGNAQGQGTATVTDSIAWTYSKGQPTWRTYFRQRSRHQSTGIRYPVSTGLWLGLIALSHGLFYLLGAWHLLCGDTFIALFFFVVRFALVLEAYLPPLEHFSAANAGARGGFWSRVRLAGIVLWGDALVGPMYLYLAVSGMFSRKEW
jgi:biofilm PGA synthesis N-glycosyltransferase PgaC